MAASSAYWSAFTIASLLSPLARNAIIKWQSAGILLGILLYVAMFAAVETGRDRDFGNIQTPTTGQQTATAHEVNEPGASKPQNSNKFYKLSIGRPMMHTTGRTWLWKAAAEYAFQNPLLGIGPMNFACKGPAHRVGSPHNLVLQILSEWGIPAAILLLLLSFSLFWLLIKDLNLSLDDNMALNTLRALLITAILAALIHLMVSNLLNSPASQIAGALIIGWWLGAMPQRTPYTKPYATTAILFVVLFCSLLLIPFAYHETVEMPSYRQQLPAGEEGLPRFWQLGKACSAQLQ